MQSSKEVIFRIIVLLMNYVSTSLTVFGKAGNSDSKGTAWGCPVVAAESVGESYSS